MHSSERREVTFYERVGKRAVDVAGAVLALVVLAPALLLTAAAIKLEDGGDIFFRQTRVGKNGTRFSLLKFRSMPQNAPEIPSADAAALKVTRVGRLIRRSNIDELSQLVNILRGEMSIVGPRPALPKQEELVRLRGATSATAVAPGLTGLAQVEAYTGMTLAEKVKWDARYADQVSFWADVKIVLRTVLYLFRQPPVY